MDFGEISIQFALISSLISTFSFAHGSFKKDLRLLKIGEKALHFTTILLLSSLTILIYYFLSDNFSFSYVYFNSDIHLPIYYKISAVWASKEGSLLLWAFCTSFLASIFVNVEKMDLNLAKSLIIVCSFIFSLISIVLFTSNPFTRLAYTHPNGLGLNPLLRTPEMIFHPPAIFLGYAAVTFPFATALVSKDFKRNWILLSWFFLTIGIFLGAWWAYKTLGWGGFWAWDPVENASLLPWITLTAALHIKRGKESYFLIVLSFLLVILATFITRSGIIKSVHAFSQSLQGGVYLIIILVFFAASIYVYFKDRDDEKIKEIKMSTTLSVFLLLMIFFLSAVFAGTMSSIFTSVNRFYYYTTALPVFGLVAALIGICFAKNFKIPIVLASISSLAVFFLVGIIGASATFIFSFSTSILMLEFLKRLNRKFSINFGDLSKLLIHLGIVFLFVGSTFVWMYEVKHENVKINRLDTVEIEGFKISYEGALMKQDDEKYTLIAFIKLNNKTVVLKQYVYKIYRSDRVVNSVDTINYLTHDVYIALKGFSEDFNAVTVDLYIIPLIFFVWVGFYLLMIGGYFALVR